MHCKIRRSWLFAGLVLGVAAGCGEGDLLDGAGYETLDASDGIDARENDAGGSSSRDAGFENDEDADLPGQEPADAGSMDPQEEDASVNQPQPDAGGPSTDGDRTDDVPDSANCDDARDWDEQAAMFEEEVLRLTNEARARGHNCDTRGVKPPAPALTMESRLRCAARLHSKYMSETGDFAHTTSTGSTVEQRIMAAGYAYSWMGENIAAGYMSAQQVVDGWLDSDGHCDNLMNPRFTEIGIGYVQGTRSAGRLMHWWTQNFGAPRRR